MTLVTFWFVVLVVLWTGFLVLEGFDFGVGMLHGVVGRDERGDPRPDAATVPMAQFLCRNCGHITLFDARRLGLLSS